MFEDTISQIIAGIAVALILALFTYLVRTDRSLNNLNNQIKGLNEQVKNLRNLVNELRELRNLASKQITQVGEVDFPEIEAEKFYDNRSVGKRTIGVRVIFDTPFSRQPKVSVSLKKFDLGDPKANIHRINITAEKIGCKGFTLCFETWHESQIYSAAASWIAIGE